MSEKFSPHKIPIAVATATVLDIPARLQTSAGHLVTDRLTRPLRDLRISVTDRCNFRCTYCMPKAVYDNTHLYLPHKDLLSFEEITRLAQQFVQLGVRKIRLTGGEPLLRKGIEDLIHMLASLRTPRGEALDLAMTTNGSLLERKAHSLRAAGLKRVTVSLDALDDTVFRQMNDVDFPVADVLRGIDAAQQAGLGPVKVNMVVKRSANLQEVVPMAQYFAHRGVELRYIEFMDVGTTNHWNTHEVVPSAELRQLLSTQFTLHPLPADGPGDTAQRWSLAPHGAASTPDGSSVGFVSSVSSAFCGNCNRARLSTEGKLYTCLFAAAGYDLRHLLRAGASDAQLLDGIAGIWENRSDRYSQLRSSPQAPATGQHKIEMSYIGG